MYRPLPSEVTIAKSNIDGLGLFSTCDIAQGFELGITHVENSDFDNGYIRTPLGGFINHSNSANCKLVKDGDVLVLVTKDIVPNNTELTTYYSLYNISDEEKQ